MQFKTQVYYVVHWKQQHTGFVTKYALFKTGTFLGSVLGTLLFLFQKCWLVCQSWERQATTGEISGRMPARVQRLATVGKAERACCLKPWSTTSSVGWQSGTRWSDSKIKQVPMFLIFGCLQVILNTCSKKESGVDRQNTCTKQLTSNEVTHEDDQYSIAIRFLRQIEICGTNKCLWSFPDSPFGVLWSILDFRLLWTLRM